MTSSPRPVIRMTSPLRAAWSGSSARRVVLPGSTMTSQSSNSARKVLPACPAKVISYVCGRANVTPRRVLVQVVASVPGGRCRVITHRRVTRGRLTAVPWPADPPRPPAGAAATARPLPACRDPHPAAAATSAGLTCALTTPLLSSATACQPRPAGRHLNREPGGDPRAASMLCTWNPDPSRSLRRLGVLFAETGQSGACLREIVCDGHLTQLLAVVSMRPAWGGISGRDRRRWARGLR